jgi:hypothetical protein
MSCEKEIPVEEKFGREAPQPNLDECLIRIRLHKRCGTYVAHCLELDIVAVDDKPWKAVEKCALLMNRQIAFGIEHENEENIWFPAPAHYEPPTTK